MSCLRGITTLGVVMASIAVLYAADDVAETGTARNAMVAGIAKLTTKQLLTKYSDVFVAAATAGELSSFL